MPENSAHRLGGALHRHDNTVTDLLSGQQQASITPLPIIPQMPYYLTSVLRTQHTYRRIGRSNNLHAGMLLLPSFSKVQTLAADG